MSYLIDTHILLWWHGDRDQLSREQRDVIAAAGADSRLEVSDISLWEVAMLYSLGTGPLDDSTAGVAGKGGRRAVGAPPWHLAGGGGRVGVVARFLSLRPGRSRLGGDRPRARRDTSDTGQENCRSGAGRHAGLTWARLDRQAAPGHRIDVVALALLRQPSINGESHRTRCSDRTEMRLRGDFDTAQMRGLARRAGSVH